MLIKAADDKSKRVDLLQSLLDSSVLQQDQRDWARKELFALQQGVRGEKDAAHYIDNHFGANDSLAVIHDLRLEVEGEVAQIDHLMISRGFIFYLLETKHFNGNLRINEYGEFAVSYPSKTWGIPSPVEQSRRHENVLVKLLNQLGISGRIQKQPEFRHVVLVNPKSTISRPDRTAYDSSNVIKADQFASWREKHVQGEMSVLKTLGALMNMRASDTVMEWAQMLCRQHRPPNLLALPALMAPRMAKVEDACHCAQCGQPVTAAEAAYCRSHVSAFGNTVLCRAHQAEHKRSQNKQQPDMQSTGPETADLSETPRKRHACEKCGSKISRAEAIFCWSNEKRFGGVQYCRVHQSEFK